jgi:hypothetical protein
LDEARKRSTGRMRDKYVGTVLFMSTLHAGGVSPQATPRENLLCVGVRTEVKEVRA